MFLKVVGMGDSKHIFKDFGIRAQDGAVDMEAIFLDNKDNISII